MIIYTGIICRALVQLNLVQSLMDNRLTIQRLLLDENEANLFDDDERFQVLAALE